MPQNILTGQTVDTYSKFKTESFYLFGGINSKASSYANGPTEFRDISNLNFLYPGSLTKRPGSTMYVGSTVTGNILGGTEFQRLSGNSTIVFASNTNLYTGTPPTTITPVVTGLTGSRIFNFVTFVDRLFCTNGTNFFKFDGTNNYKFSLPPGATAAWGVSPAIGGSLTAGLSTVIFAAYGYVNERGYVGPISNAVTLTLNGITFNSFTYFGMTLDQAGYGITAIQLWRSSPGGVDLFGTTQIASGSTTATDSGMPLGNSLAIPHLWFTMIPKYQAIFNNQYFMAGFSQFPSRVYWSEIGEPEAIQPNFYAEFRTNDGDSVSGLKFYNGMLIVPKYKSAHRITGDNPSNFSLQELSNEYGCLSNQAMVVFENVLWFLDQKGVVEYNGANIEMISDKPEPNFLAMNVPASIDKALAIHYKQYNEVWFHIPSNGATLNNSIVVYDYLTKAWTSYNGINASCVFVAQGTQNAKTVFYGGYTGGLFYFGSSFMGDNGSGITCMAFSRFIAPNGQTTENMYRRFWSDVDPVLGFTQAIGVQLFSNYNESTVQFTGVVYQSVFQTRLDFGISARTLAAKVTHYSASLPFKLNAYSFASRYLRNV